jgi:putative glutamine amidotransferase
MSNTDCVHNVRIEPGSLVAKIIEQDKVDINSAHHQSVAHTGDRLRVSGRTGEGVAEFLEHVDPDQWIIGVQGHIEVEYGNPGLRRIFKAFADKIRGK